VDLDSAYENQEENALQETGNASSSLNALLLDGLFESVPGEYLANAEYAKSDSSDFYEEDDSDDHDSDGNSHTFIVNANY
jgi:hypothetical protein